MIEQLKTYLLIGLVGLSVILTWEIWTYQPHYDYLLPTEYVTHEGLAERRESSDLIRPEHIIYHYGDQRYTISEPDKYEYTSVIKEQMKNWYFYSFREIAPSQFKQWNNLSKRYEGLELTFSTSIPFTSFQDMFTIGSEEHVLKGADSVFLYINPITEEVTAMFINYPEKKLIRANTSITVGELRQYLALGENRTEYEALVIEDQEDALNNVVYLSTAPIEMTEYRYFYRKIFIDKMISYLFVDPTLVREIHDRNGESFYTDGTRGIQLNQDQTAMYYVHPLAERSPDDNTTNQFIPRSIQFVNQHKGWEQNFYLHQIDSPFADEAVVQFRRYISHYPVYSVNPEEEQNVIQLEVQDGRVVGYYRPLIEIDRVMNQINREMPAATEIINRFREANIPVSNIKKVELAYVSEYQENFVSFIPHWVVEWKNGERNYIRKIEDINQVIDDQEAVKEEETGELE